jgi:hypothetical protein
MADGVVEGLDLHLYDNWPTGEVLTGTSVNYGDMTAAAVHNVTSPVYALGTKKRVRLPEISLPSAHPAGWATFIYLKLCGVTEANPTCAAKQLVVPTAAGDIFTVTNDPDRCLLKTGSPYAAVMLSVMTPTFTTVPKYGWFWCGGDVPVAVVGADIDGNFATDGTVTATNGFMASDLAADAIGIALVTGILTAIGYSDIIDT